jgi:ABC-type ATPase involved in cell division
MAGATPVLSHFCCFFALLISSSYDLPMIEFVDLRLDHSSIPARHPGQPGESSSILKSGNLTVATGSVGLIIAGAGVGSSRLMASLLGDKPATSGATMLFGHNTQKLRRSSLRNLRRRVGIVPQDLSLIEDRSAQLNVALPLEIDGVPRSISIQRASEALRELGLESEAALPVDCLSASARQRVAVARALVRKPDILLFDQPTDRQDVDGALLVCRAVAAAAMRGATCLIVSRDAAVRSFADQDRWSQWIMAGGSLHSAAEVTLDNAVIDELLVHVESAPVRGYADNRVSNGIPSLVRFPLSARTLSAQ